MTIIFTIRALLLEIVGNVGKPGPERILSVEVQFVTGRGVAGADEQPVVDGGDDRRVSGARYLRYLVVHTDLLISRDHVKESASINVTTKTKAFIKINTL